jgi:hypothetical protein
MKAIVDEFCEPIFVTEASVVDGCMEAAQSVLTVGRKTSGLKVSGIATKIAHFCVIVSRAKSFFLL